MAWIMAAGAVAGGVLGAMGNDDSDAAKTQQSSSNESSASNGQSTWQPAAALMPAYGSAMGTLNQYAQTPQPYFPGQTYVDPSTMTQTGVSMLGRAGDATFKSSDLYNLATNQAPYATEAYNQGAGVMGQGAAALGSQGVQDQMNAINQGAGTNYNFLSGAADVANNPYVQGQLKANESSVMNTLQNSALPSLQAGAIGVNALGSSRLGLAQGQAIGDSMEALSQANASTMLNAYGQGLTAQQSALGETGNMLVNQTAPAQALINSGAAYGQAGGLIDQGAASYATAGQNAQQAATNLAAGAGYYGQGGQVVEGYQQAALDDAMARYNYQYEEPMNRATNTINALNGLANTGTTYTSSGSAGTATGTGDNPNYMTDTQAALGGAATGAGLGSTIANYW